MRKQCVWLVPSAVISIVISGCAGAIEIKFSETRVTTFSDAPQSVGAKPDFVPEPEMVASRIRNRAYFVAPSVIERSIGDTSVGVTTALTVPPQGDSTSQKLRNDEAPRLPENEPAGFKVIMPNCESLLSRFHLLPPGRRAVMSQYFSRCQLDYLLEEK